MVRFSAVLVSAGFYLSTVLGWSREPHDVQSSTPAGGRQPPPLPAIAGPVVNGISLENPGWGPEQRLVHLGLLDVTQPPFSADPTGHRDATEAIQTAVDAGRMHYLTVYFPSGSYKVTKTISVLQPEKMVFTTVGDPNCNENHEVLGGSVFQHLHCARTAPAILQGSKRGDRPELVVPSGIGLVGPVVKLTNFISENINMNQVLTGIDIRIEHGNPNAIGVYGRGAQGVSIQDVTIYAGDAAIGIEGAAGSGGSHINVTVIGGKIGMKVGKAQPSPTLTAIRLVNQTESALVYEAPGRQTLTVTALHILSARDASGPAILSEAPISIVDSRVEGSGSFSGIVASTSCSLFMQNVWISGYQVLLTLPNGNNISSSKSAQWMTFKTVAAQSVDLQSGATTPIYIDGRMENEPMVDAVLGSSPPAELCSQHMWPDNFPTWESEGACFATDFGAKGDLITDDTEALRRMLNSSKCKVFVIPKGYFSISSTLDLPESVALVGVGRIYSNIVPHPSVAPLRTKSQEPWPLLRTSSCDSCSTTISAMSIILWRHINASYALHWQSGKGYWRRAHIDRVDLSPGKYEGAIYNQPLALMTGYGGGQFYNFYQETWDWQGPNYRHLLVLGTSSPWNCYHCNLEHSQGEANLEIRGAKAPISIYGFKGEGNYAQIWVVDSAEFFLAGYGGNAAPFPKYCHYPPGYADYVPSVLRIERTSKFTLANIMLQVQGTETKCGIYDTGFAGTFYDMNSFSVLHDVGDDSTGNFTVPPGQWPVFYTRGAHTAVQKGLKDASDSQILFL